MKKLLLLFVIMFIAKMNVNAQNEKFKALFIYNFTKYIEWPTDYKQGNFIITVVGSSSIVDELEVIASKKKVGSQDIEVKKVSNPSQIGKSHIVFLPSYKSSILRSTMAILQSKSSLVVTDGSNLVQQGAGINFVETGGKQGFEIKRANIERKGLKVSGSLLTLGTIIE